MWSIQNNISEYIHYFLLPMSCSIECETYMAEGSESTASIRCQWFHKTRLCVSPRDTWNYMLFCNWQCFAHFASLALFSVLDLICKHHCFFYHIVTSDYVISQTALGQGFIHNRCLHSQRIYMLILPLRRNETSPFYSMIKEQCVLYATWHWHLLVAFLSSTCYAAFLPYGLR